MVGFGTAGIRGPVRDVVTPSVALRVGRAAGHEALRAGDDEFVVARDGRVTGRVLADAFAAGLASAGATVRRAGRLPTPALAFASRGRRGGMLTASHNPPADNGIKLFRDGREYDRAAEARVEAGVASPGSPAAWDAWGAVSDEPVLDAYREAVVAYVESVDAAGDLTVAVDCGNGTAGDVTPRVLRALGFSVTAINDNVDGHFPGRASKPTAESLTALRSFVAEGSFDLGVAHDGDADRLVVVDPDGEIVHEDTVVAVLAAHAVRASDDADPVVITTPNASARIDDRVTAAGGRMHRVRLGGLHEGLVEVREAGGDVVFAAEPWKHLHPGFGPWIDGIVSAGVLARLVAAAEGIDALTAPVRERPYRKADVECPEGAKETAMAAIRDDLPAAFTGARVDTEYGVRLDFDDGAWLLVRPSGTEPYLRVYAEAADVDALVETALDVVEDAVAAA